jgi:tetratricopeptide (TPR) repeat protein
MLIAMLMIVAAAAPAGAEQTAAAAVDLSRLQELTGRYGKQYRDKAYDEAIVSATEALAAAEAALGPDDAGVAQVLNDLGHLYEIKKDFAAAEPLHERALKIRERVFNDDGPVVVQSLHHLANVYTAQARHADTQRVYKRSLAILERSLPPGDPAFVALLEPYANSLQASGDLDMAESMRARSWAIRMNHGEQP